MQLSWSVCALLTIGFAWSLLENEDPPKGWERGNSISHWTCLQLRSHPSAETETERKGRGGATAALFPSPPHNHTRKEKKKS